MSRASDVGHLRKYWPSGAAALAPLHEQPVSLGQPSGPVLARFVEGTPPRPMSNMRMAEPGCDVPEEDASHASSMSRLCFEFAGAGQAPILSERAASVFREMAPNVARTVRCIDDTACEEARRYTPDDDMPDKADQYHVVSGLRIDKSKVGDERVFRLSGWSSPIIVGGRFDEV